MSLPTNVRAIAERVLTPKQLEAWLLWEDEFGYGRIGDRLGISTSAARNRVYAALRNIEIALETNGTPADCVRVSDPSRAAKAA